MTLEQEYDRAVVLNEAIRQGRQRWGARFGVQIDSRQLSTWMYQLEGYSQPLVENLRAMLGGKEPSPAPKPPPEPPAKPEPKPDPDLPEAARKTPLEVHDPWSA